MMKENDEIQTELNINQSQEDKEEILRLRAEIDNMRKRFEIARKNDALYAIERLLHSLLPVLDSLEIASKDQVADRGINLTWKLMLSELEKYGVTTIMPSETEPFNAVEHEAIKFEEDPLKENHSIAYIIQRGYKLHQRVIRPARICLIQNEEKEKGN